MPESAAGIPWGWGRIAHKVTTLEARMRQNRNPILTATIARIEQLIKQYEESKSISHGGTIGSLREAYLTQFVTAFIPSPFLSLSGFVTDSRGHEVSPQLDLLIADGNSIPPFMLGNSVGIVPLESVRLIVEAKSTLKTSDFGQLQLQQDTFRKMRFSWTSADRAYLTTVNCEYMSQIVVSFDSNCSKEALEKLFSDIEGLSAICVVQKFIMLRNRRKDIVETIESDGSHSEILHLISFIQHEIRNSHIELGSPLTAETPDGMVDIFPDIGAYLTFDVPEPK